MTITIGQIQSVVAREFGVPVIEMTSDRRDAEATKVRHLAMYLARELTGHSYPRIGRAFGRRDHTTVMHGVKRALDWIAYDPALAARVERLKEHLSGGGDGQAAVVEVVSGGLASRP